VARTKQTIRGIGQLTYFSLPAINDSGQTAFYAGAGDGITGLYTASGGVVRQIARVGLPAPNGAGNWDYIGQGFYNYQPALNSAGQIAFAGIVGAHSGLFINSGNSMHEIFGSGIPASDGNGVVAGVGLWGFNDAGQSVVQVGFNGTSGADRHNGGKVDDSGLYRVSENQAQLLARTATRTPDGTAYFQRFFDTTMNEKGLVAYLAILGPTPDSFSFDEGIFLTDGIDTVQVARYGGQLGDRYATTLSFGMSASHGQFRADSLDPSRRPLNNFGQVAFQAQTSSNAETIGLFTPKLRWRSLAGGNWDDRANWTLSIVPYEMHDVVIDPVSATTIQGPAGEGAVRSLLLGPSYGAAATLQLGGAARLRAVESVTVGPQGSLRLDIGAELAAASVINDGLIAGVGVITATVNNRQGTIAPGNVVGTLQIDGDFAQSPGGTLAVQLGDTSDELQVGGDALIGGGALAVSFLEGFAPQLGESFDFLTATGTITGQFDTMTLPHLDNNWSWHLVQQATKLSLTIGFGIAGDFNADGRVDVADYVVWRNRLGSVYTQADYDVWRSHFGQTQGGGAGFGSMGVVPEPGIAGLLVFGVVACRDFRRPRFFQTNPG
jgi:hypothetical protein